MGDNIAASSFDFKLACRRERSMTEPLLEEDPSSENHGMPAAFYRSSSEDENTNDSGVSFAYDRQQPTSFKQAFDNESDCDLTPKAFKTPRKALGDITKQCENRDLCEDSPISRKSSLLQRKRVISSVCSLANISTPSESELKRSKFAGASAILRTMSTSALEVASSPPSELSVTYSLEVVEKPQMVHEAYKSISGDCLFQLMSTMSDTEFQQKYIVIDCRYPYEYNGGHVKGAINVHDTTELEKCFYDVDLKKPLHSRIPIFYCEYSQKRGPAMARQLRKLDRSANYNTYPRLDFEEIYLLDRGYKKLYEVDQHYEICEPQSYIVMDHPDYISSLRKHKSHQKGNKMPRAFSRNQSLREIGRAVDSLDSPMHHMKQMRISPDSSAIRKLSFNDVTPKTSRS